MGEPIRSTSHAAVNGGALCFDEWDGEGPPVLFLHATGFSRGCWRPAAEQLTDLCRPVAIDLRGHGGSEARSEPYEWAALADDVAALIAERWREPVVLVGHSVGGATAVEVAARFELPVDQLILLEPVLREGVALSPEQRANAALSPLVERTRGRRSVWDGRAEAVEYLRQRSPYDSWDAAVYHAWTQTGLENSDLGVQLTCPPEVEASVYSETGGSRASQLLGDVACPTWIVRATGARGMPSTCPPSVAAELRDCTEFVVEGSGHFLPLERPDIVVATIRHALTLARAV